MERGQRVGANGREDTRIEKTDVNAGARDVVSNRTRLPTNGRNASI